MQGILTMMSGYIKPYILQVSIIIVTCGLVVFDSYIHGTIKRMIHRLNFVLRVSTYIILFTFVYGFLVTYLSPILARLLYSMSNAGMLVTLLLVFIILGVLIERK